MKLLLVFGVLCGFCFMAYSNGLHNAFMWDDGPAFSDIKLKNLKFLPNAFFYGAPHSNPLDSFVNSDRYYRPMTYVITLLSYLAFGKNPFGYHVLNLLLFALMGFSVYIFIDFFFKNKSLAFITSLLFALHPINVFYVDYITSPIHSLRFICMLISLIFFMKAIEGAHQLISYGVSLVCFIAALLCHETSVVLPFYGMFMVYYFKKRGLKEAAIKSLPYWSVLLLYLFFRFQFTGLGHAMASNHVNPFHYMATFSKIIFLYVSKLFFPQGIVFFWNSPWMRGLDVVIWTAGLLTVLAGWWLLAKSRDRNIIFFCATWLLTGFIPVFWAAYPPYDKIYYGLIIEPQWLTFASLGFFLFAAFLGLKIYARWRKGAVLLFLSLLVLLIVVVRRDNAIWGDEYNYYFYWSQQIKPLPPVNYAYLADLFLRKKEYIQARYYFSKTLKKRPDASDLNNLGLLDEKEGLWDKAREEFLLSIRTDPAFSSAYNNLGVVYFKQGNYPSAKEVFLKTVTLNKYSIEARSNLGLICLLQADDKGAIRYYQEILNIVPYDEDSLLGLVQAYAGLKELENMEKYVRLLAAHGKDPEILAALKKFLAAHPRNRFINGK